MFFAVEKNLPGRMSSILSAGRPYHGRKGMFRKVRSPESGNAHLRENQEGRFNLLHHKAFFSCVRFVSGSMRFVGSLQTLTMMSIEGRKREIELASIYCALQ